MSTFPEEQLDSAGYFPAQPGQYQEWPTRMDDYRKLGWGHLACTRQCKPFSAIPNDRASTEEILNDS
jgi:hypothetical protein